MTPMPSGGHLTLTNAIASLADHYPRQYPEIMPGGMNGWELADLARQIRPGLPVLFSSGYGWEALVEQGRASAELTILGKPCRKAELAHRLREALTATAPAS
jgi:CheY-like chemotaxis protein